MAMMAMTHRSSVSDIARLQFVFFRITNSAGSSRRFGTFISCLTRPPNNPHAGPVLCKTGPLEYARYHRTFQRAAAGSATPAALQFSFVRGQRLGCARAVAAVSFAVATCQDGDRKLLCARL